MKLITIMLFVLVCVNATPKYTFDYSNKRSITAVMAQVETKLNNKSPLDAVLNVLRDFRDSVNNEQVNHDEVYNIQVAECSSENEFRSLQVKDSQTVLRDSNFALNICNTSKIRTTNVLEVNQQQYFSAQEHLEIVVKTAESEAGYFKKRGRDYEDALHAIDEAQDILVTIYNGSGSFTEISELAKSMLQTAFNIGETGKFAPIFYAFSQLATQEGQIDDSGLERVAQLLETLRSDIQEAYNDYASSNAVSIAAFNDQKDRLGSTIARLEAQSERLQNKLTNLVQCIGTQSAIASSASGKLQRNQQLWDQAQALCSTFANEYNYATQARRNELKLVTQLEEMVVQRFNQVEDEKPQLSQKNLYYKNW